MAENKTKASLNSVTDFLKGIEDPKKQEDCFRIASLMEEITGAAPKMWGESIVGFGDYQYKYASGREGDWFLCGFSPRKRNLTLYIMAYLEHHSDILENLGKFKNGKGCLYINKLEDIDEKVLRTLIETTIPKLKKTN